MFTDMDHTAQAEFRIMLIQFQSVHKWIEAHKHRGRWKKSVACTVSMIFRAKTCTGRATLSSYAGILLLHATQLFSNLLSQTPGKNLAADKMADVQETTLSQIIVSYTQEMWNSPFYFEFTAVAKKTKKPSGVKC